MPVLFHGFTTRLTFENELTIFFFYRFHWKIYVATVFFFLSSEFPIATIQVSEGFIWIFNPWIVAGIGMARELFGLPDGTYSDVSKVATDYTNGVVRARFHGGSNPSDSFHSPWISPFHGLAVGYENAGEGISGVEGVEARIARARRAMPGGGLYHHYRHFHRL